MPNTLSAFIEQPVDSVDDPVATNPFVSLRASLHPAINTHRTDRDTISSDNFVDIYVPSQNTASKKSETTTNLERIRDDPKIYIDNVDGPPMNIPNEIDLNTSHVFDKSKEYDKWLNKPNPWHPDLHRRLFPSQVIGFRWMCDRHLEGGGLVADVVGCGKVWLSLTF
jgi:SNF2 family DNA or RNA helicase